MTFDWRTGRNVAIVVVAALLSVFLIERTLSASWTVEREVDIGASPSEVFAVLVNLRQWNRWNLVHAPARPPETEFSGPATGVGSTARWNGDRGRCVLKIMDTLPNRRVEYTLLTDAGARMTTGVLRISPRGKGSHLAWRATFSAEPLLLARYRAWFEKNDLARDIEQSLARLKLELGPKT